MTEATLQATVFCCVTPCSLVKKKLKSVWKPKVEAAAFYQTTRRHAPESSFPNVFSIHLQEPNIPLSCHFYENTSSPSGIEVGN